LQEIGVAGVRSCGQCQRSAGRYGRSSGAHTRQGAFSPGEKIEPQSQRGVTILSQTGIITARRFGVGTRPAHRIGSKVSTSRNLSRVRLLAARIIALHPVNPERLHELRTQSAGGG
jgi:hypothetical protein